MGQRSWVMSPGQIIRAEVQYSDSEKTKTRFPVIVSCRTFNERHPDVVVAFATRTANIRHPRDYDVEISDKRSDFGLTGLSEPTTVRCGRLWSIDKRKISDVLGVLPDDIWTDVLHLVQRCFIDS